MKKTIFLKLIGTYFIIIVTCLAILGTSLTFMFKNYLFDQKEKELIIKGKDIAQVVKPYLVDKEDPHSIINLINRSDLNLGTEVWVVDRNGKVIAAAANHEYCEGNSLEISELKEMQSGLISVRQGQSQYFEEAVTRVTVPILESKKVIGAIIVYSPLLGVNKTVDNIIKMIFYAGILSLTIAVLVGIILSRLFSRPILNMALAAISLAKGEKKVSVELDSDIEEINQLGKAFNYMSNKIEENEVRMKDFVANVSHELRSPLTSIKGFVEALVDNKGKNEDDKKKYLMIINKETDRLTVMVQNLLALAKAESVTGKTAEKIDIVSFIKNEIINLEEMAKQKSINIEIINHESLPNIIFEQIALKQIIINLIENAIKYSYEGTQVQIDFKLEDDKLWINIKDEGPGIPEGDLPYIWDRFYRVDKARNRETGGTGLGLAIVKQLVKNNNGEVHVESKINKGTIFSFTAPLINN